MVASAGDEMLMFWNVFGTPEITKPAKKTENAALFSGDDPPQMKTMRRHIFIKMWYSLKLYVGICELKHFFTFFMLKWIKLFDYLRPYVIV